MAFKGRVYDVTASYHWREGRHSAIHSAGEDLTEAMQNAPHVMDLLLRFPLVGKLTDDERDNQTTIG